MKWRGLQKVEPAKVGFDTAEVMPLRKNRGQRLEKAPMVRLVAAERSRTGELVGRADRLSSTVLKTRSVST